MGLGNRAAEFFMIGFGELSLSPDVQALVKRVSGVILFARNMETPGQVRDLTGQLQQLAGNLPLLVSTDQEGGVVSRITGGEPVRPGNMSRGGSRAGLAGTPWPGNMTLGAARSADLALRVAWGTGRELLALGINLNLAPVLDVNNNPANPVIGVRSYGADPGLVAELGTAAIAGYREAGVMACAKHFPGHGDTAVDSHLALATVPHDLERLRQVELVPFRRAVAAGVDAVMTAHVAFPAMEPEAGRPATLSHRVLTGLLREELGFSGLILTDCMEMKAIADAPGGVPEAAVQAILAGADLVLVSHTYERQVAAIEAVSRAIDSGRIPPQRVRESLDRIRRVRQRLSRIQPDLSVVGCAEHLALAVEAAERSVTRVGELPPVDPTGTVAIGVDPSPVTLAEEGPPTGSPFLRALAEAAPEVRQLAVSREPSAAEIEQAVTVTAGARFVVVATYAAHLFPQQADLVRSLVGAGRHVLLVTQRGPYDLAVTPGVAGALVTYEDRILPARAAVQVLLGAREAGGRLP